MAENSKIEWCDATFNPWLGCTRVAEGCKHCYAETLMDSRYGKAKWGPHGTRVLTSPANWRKPLQWNKAAEAAGVRQRVFCASLADVFEDWGGGMLDHHQVSAWRKAIAGETPLVGDKVPFRMNDARQHLFDLIDQTPWLDWLLLTKRPENVRQMWPRCQDCGYTPQDAAEQMDHHLCAARGGRGWHRPNVWIGCSISTQADADRNIHHLRACRELSPVLFVSGEPLLGPVDAGEWIDAIDWVIVGGESGPHARPMHPDWARQLRDQCQAAGVPFFFKQWGEWLPFSQWSWAPPEIQAGTPSRFRQTLVPRTSCEGSHQSVVSSYNVGKQSAGRLLDGVAWSQFPDVAAAVR